MSKLKKLLPYVFIILILFGAIMMANLPTALEYGKNGATDINTLALNEMDKNDPVCGNVKESWGSFAEQYSTKFGIRTSSKSDLRYYLLGLEDRYVMIETGSKADFDKLDAMAEEFFAYANSEENTGEYKPTQTFEVEGYAIPVSDEIHGFLSEYMNEIFGQEYTADQLSKVDTCVIRIADLERIKFMPLIGAGCIAIGLLGLIVLLVRFLKNRRSSANEYY